MENQKKRRSNQPRRKAREEKTFLASASIKTKRDTEILKEDLFNEVILDATGQGDKLVHDKYVLFFDENQSFYKGLLALLNNSHTLRNVIENKKALTLGDGFIPVESEKVAILQTFRKLVGKITGSDNALEDLNELISCVNFQGETLEDVIEKVVFDFYAFGNAFVELKKATKEGQPIYMLHHTPVYTIGIHKQDPKTALIPSVGICQDWENLGGDTANITDIPLYPEFSKDGRTVIHIKNYAAGFYYWGLPSNIAARFWAEIEYRIPKYNISKFKNGFVPSSLLQFYGNMTPDEAKKVVEHTTEAFTDTGKNSKMMVQVLRDSKYKADVQLLEDKNDGSYMDLATLAAQAIVTANQWTMSLAGFATSGKLGSNQQIREELEYITNTSVKGVRRKVLQQIVNPFVALNSEINGGKFAKIKLDIANMNPISFASSLDPKSTLLVNEQRSAMGYDALDEEALNQLTNQQNPTGNGFNNSSGDS